MRKSKLRRCASNFDEKALGCDFSVRFFPVHREPSYPCLAIIIFVSFGPSCQGCFLHLQNTLSPSSNKCPQQRRTNAARKEHSMIHNIMISSDCVLIAKEASGHWRFSYPISENAPLACPIKAAAVTNSYVRSSLCGLDSSQALLVLHLLRVIDQSTVR